MASDVFPFGMDHSTDATDSDSDDGDSWDWGTVVTTDGDPLPPGACDGYHNKARQRDIIK